MNIRVTVKCWRDKDWYVGRAKEIPGVFSQGKSLAALKDNLTDAITLMLEEGNDTGGGDACVPSSPPDPPCHKASVQLQLSEDTGDD